MPSIGPGSPAKQLGLRTILQQPHISRVEIAEATRMTAATAGVVVNQLLHEQRIQSTTLSPPRPRRSSAPHHGAWRTGLAVTDLFWAQHAATRRAVLPALKPRGVKAYNQALDNAVLLAQAASNPTGCPEAQAAGIDCLQLENIGHIAILNHCLPDISRRGQWFRGPGAWDLLVTGQAQIITGQNVTV